MEMLLYGAGGHAKVVIDCLMEKGLEVTGIFDDMSDLVSLNGFDVLGKYSRDVESEKPLIVTIGDNTARKKIVQSVSHQFGKIAHPSCVISNYAYFSEGTVILHGSIVQTGTKIGKHCIINTASSIDHDVTISDFVHISPKVTLCDRVVVKEGAHIGAGATVLPNLTIGKWCVIGAGAVITQNLPDYSVVVGVPGKIIKQVDM